MDEYDEAAHQRVTLLARSAPDQALAIAEDLITRFPSDARAWASLAYAFEMKQDFSQALTALQKAATLAPSEPVSYFDLGLIHIDLESYDEAIEAFSDTIELSIKNSFHYYLKSSHFLRAYCFCKLSNVDQAERDLLNIDEDASWWIGKLRTKTELIEACRKRVFE